MAPSSRSDASTSKVNMGSRKPDRGKVSDLAAKFANALVKLI